MLALALLLAASSMNASADARDVGMRFPSSGATLTIAAMPYARTVTCGSYTLTGSASGAGAVSWSASPSGASGSCTGTTSWSCVVSVAPDATGEGVETITVLQSGGGSDTETIGFYVDGEHSCFLAQSIDGSYNSTLANLDAVATWTNLGSSAKNVTQGTGAAQPTYRTSIVGGQPVVRCDGGDWIAGLTASDWTFLHNGTDATVDLVFNPSLANPGASSVIFSTVNSASTLNAMAISHGDGATNNNFLGRMYGAASQIGTQTSAANTFPTQSFSLIQDVLDEVGGAGLGDWVAYANGSNISGVVTGTYSSTNPPFPLTLCAHGNAVSPTTGDLFRVLIYQSALTATQRGINKAVDEWALGGTLPVTP